MCCEPIIRNQTDKNSILRRVTFLEEEVKLVSEYICQTSLQKRDIRGGMRDCQTSFLMKPAGINTVGIRLT